MVAPRMNQTERPTTRKMGDELLGDEGDEEDEEAGVVLAGGLFEEAGVVLVGGLFERVVDSSNAVKEERVSTEASSLRRTLIKNKKCSGT